MPLGLSIWTYEENGSPHLYNERLPKEWKIAFAAEPNDALIVNGTIYPQHKMPKNS
jgi:hypothetical protein